MNVVVAARRPWKETSDLCSQYLTKVDLTTSMRFPAIEVTIDEIHCCVIGRKCRIGVSSRNSVTYLPGTSFA
ncbi:hypothetical protein ABH945_002995 [Paraburkholderia sp. GAS333]